MSYLGMFTILFDLVLPVSLSLSVSLSPSTRTSRAVAASALPVVSAVGHEIDITIADLVAYRRAFTPSEAAELVLPRAADLADELAALRQRLRTALRGDLDLLWERVKALGATRVLRDPLDRIRQAQQRLDDLAARLPVRLKDRLASARKETAALAGRMPAALQGILTLARTRTGGMAGRLEGLSPLKVLARGYSVTMLEGEEGRGSTPARDANDEGRPSSSREQSRDTAARILKSARDVKPGDRLRTRLGEGEIRSRVEEGP